MRECMGSYASAGMNECVSESLKEGRKEGLRGILPLDPPSVLHETNPIGSVGNHYY